MATLCTDRFSIPFGDDVILDPDVAVDDYTPLQLPYCSSQPIDQPDSKVGGLIISLHGVGGGAQSYLTNAEDVLSRVNYMTRKTLIVAPQFIHEDEVTGDLPADVLYWRGGRFWGNPSASTENNPRSAQIRSFDVMDRLLTYLTDSNRFPNLRAIVIVGHSGGGQFTNRYAASCQFESTVAEPLGIHMRYIVINPGTYLYLSDKRPAEGTLNQFKLLSGSVECDEYNDYGYGLDALWNYPNRIGATAIRENYQQREVVYLLGSNDTVASNSFPSECQAMAQGANRLERGIAYYNHLVDLFGVTIADKHILMIVEGVGHWGWGMMTSDDGVRAICDPLAVSLYEVVQVGYRRLVFNYLDYQLTRMIDGIRRFIVSMSGRQPTPPDPSEG
jgi:hypothetical protein